jgi:hypothetical protein
MDWNSGRLGAQMDQKVHMSYSEDWKLKLAASWVLTGAGTKAPIPLLFLLFWGLNIAQYGN